MTETPKPGGAAAAPIPQPVPNPEATPDGPLLEEEARFFPRHLPRHEYEPPQHKGRFRSFRDAYGAYSIWLINPGIWAFAFGAIAYALEREHFLFHACIELAVAGLMLVLTVIFVEWMLEYRQEQERKARWAMIRDDAFDSLASILLSIVRFSVEDLLDEPKGMRNASSAYYYEIEKELRKKRDALKEAKDAEAVQIWVHKIPAWHDTLAPAFNLLRTVTVPQFLHSTKNRTLLRLLLGLEAFIGESEIASIDLRRCPNYPAALSLGVITSNLLLIAGIVQQCALIQYYLEQAKTCGLKDIDEWAEF